MNKLAAVIVLLAFGTLPLRAEELPSMAVFPTIASDVVQSQFGEGGFDSQELTRQIEELIRATRRFAMFERSGEILRNSVLLEQDFANAGQALHNAAKKGKLNNVQFIAQPLITHVSVSVRRLQQEERPGQYRYTASGSVAVTLKVLDTTSGEIMFQTTRESDLPPENAIGSGLSGPNDEPLVRAAAWRALAAEAGGTLSSTVVGALFPIQVMRMQGADIFVNRGEGGGISVGERYLLFSIGAPLIDPATNETLGSTEELLGEVEIVRVNPRFSMARAIATLNGDVKAGDVLRHPPERGR